MLFSFVLPAYKSKFLKDSINSILSQTYTNYELIIVNDASPENLDKIINTYNDQRIKYYKNKTNIGKLNLIKQWNNCLSLATGEYIILASDDDIYPPHFLTYFHKVIIQYPQVHVFRSRVMDIDAHGNICGVDKQYNEYVTPEEFRYLWFNGIKGGIANCIFHRETLINFGGFVNFPLAWGSDNATILLLADNGIVNSQDHLFYFRWSEINISSQKEGRYMKEKLRARMELCNWQKQFLKINTDSALNQFYQKEIYKIHNRQIFEYVYWIIMDMDFRTFISSIKLLKNYNLITSKAKFKIVFSKLFYSCKKLVHQVLNN